MDCLRGPEGNKRKKSSLNFKSRLSPFLTLGPERNPFFEINTRCLSHRICYIETIHSYKFDIHIYC